MLEFIITILFVALPPCEYEDSANCSWNAQVDGINGEGASFVDVAGEAYYLPPEAADAVLVNTTVLDWEESTPPENRAAMEYRVVPEWVYGAPRNHTEN